ELLQDVLADRLDREAAKARRVGEHLEPEGGDRRDPVAADDLGGAEPGEAIDETVADEPGREHGAPFDHDAGEPAPGEGGERLAEIDAARRVRADLDELDAAAAKRLLPCGIPLGKRHDPGR